MIRTHFYFGKKLSHPHHHPYKVHNDVMERVHPPQRLPLIRGPVFIEDPALPHSHSPTPPSTVDAPFSSLPHPRVWTTRRLQPPASTSSSPQVNRGTDFFWHITGFSFSDFFISLTLHLLFFRGGGLSLGLLHTNIWNLFCFSLSSILPSSALCDLQLRKAQQQCPPASVLTATTAKTPCWGRST